VTDRAKLYVDLFNSAVVTGDWDRWAAALTQDVVMEFVGVPAGPYTGRSAVLDAYRKHPPDDTIEPGGSVSHAAVDVIEFDWSRGGGGVLRLSWRADRVSKIVVEFR
jgi:steroid Delta-isomerase